MRYTELVCAAGVALAAGAASADPVVVYQTDFEQTTMGPEWSGPRRLTTAPIFTRFAGRMGNETLRLTLDPVFFPRDFGEPGGGGGGSGGGTPERVWTLTFDLYTIDSWDGDNTRWGPDRFGVNINTEQTMLYSFTNTPGSPASYPGQPTLGPYPMGFWLPASDSIYRQVRLEFDPRADGPTTFDFYGMGLQNIDDESWGIDNVSVSHDTVPTPGAVGLLGIAGAAAMRRRR